MGYDHLPYRKRLREHHVGLRPAGAVAYILAMVKCRMQSEAPVLAKHTYTGMAELDLVATTLTRMRSIERKKTA